MKNVLKKLVVSMLAWEARLMLGKHNPRVIGITGSVGKTSTKDAIYSALAGIVEVRKNQKSYNSEFGAPLTILGLETAWGSALGWLSNLVIGLLRTLTSSEYPRYLVLEVGADHPGDIQSLVAWLHPEIGVVTGMGGEVPVHAEFFESIDALIREKAALIRSLPASGLAILNRDDVRVWDMRAHSKARVVSFGTSPDADVRSDGAKISYDSDGKPKGLSFRVDVTGKSIPVRLTGALGKGHMYAVLAALAVASHLELNLIPVINALEAHVPPPGRLRVLEGLHGSVLIDDTYNSSPAAVKIALETLHELETKGRKIAVLGTMRELGSHSKSEHTKVGKWVRGAADILVCVGAEARVIGESALADGMPSENVHFFGEPAEAGTEECSGFLLNFVQASDVVLLKASQYIRLEKVTQALLADSGLASELLVRQDAEWKLR